MEIDYERLGQPCRARQVLGGAIVRDRKDGRERLAITNMNEVSGAELILIDFEKDAAEVFRAPAGAGSWNVREVSGDRLVIGTFYDGTFLLFDLKRKRFIHHVRFAKEEYLWNTAMGGDGRVYTGTYPGGRLGALDLATYQVEDCGAPAAPNLYLRYVSPTPDGRLLCSFSTEKPVEKLYDPKTKTWSDVPESLKGVSMAGVWDGRLVAGNRVFEGPQFTPVPPPFPVPAAGWAADVALTTEKWLILRQGNALYGGKKGDAAPTKLGEMDLRGGRILGVADDGRLLGVRGQDYFVLGPTDTALRLRPIPAESGPRVLLPFRIAPDGRLWGGPTFGQTLCWLDPKTKKIGNTGTICDGGGEVYDLTFLGGVLYAAAYAGGDIVAYDPRQPWDQWNNKNPKVIASVGPRGYIRPAGGIVVGPDSRLYSGWMAGYGRYGGAVAVTDPATGQTELIENPLGEQTVEGLAVDDDAFYVGTSLTANGLPAKPGESARFGMLDRKTRAVLWQTEFPGVSAAGRQVRDAGTGEIAFAAGSALRVFAPKTKTLRALESAPAVGSDQIAAPGDGCLYYGSGNDVVQVDVADGKTRRRATLPARARGVAVSQDGKVYAHCGADVYRVNLR